MANVNRPRGLRPYGKIKQAVVMTAGGTVYPGDMVKLGSAGTVTSCAATDVSCGVAISYAVSGDRFLVSVDGDQLYIGQTDGTSLSAQTSIGNNCDILATAGDSTFKISRQEVDSSTLATSSKQLQIVDILQRVGNAGGEACEVIVRINKHQQFGVDAFAGI